MKSTFESFKRLFRKPEPEAPPANVVDMEAARIKRDRDRWLIKWTRPMPPKDPPEAA